MMLEAFNCMRNYLDPTFAPPANIRPLSYGWTALTHMSEEATRIQNKALRYIAEFFALCFDATVGCGLVGSLLYNPTILLYNNTYVPVRNFFAKSEPAWNETALKVWGVIAGIGLCYYLGTLHVLDTPSASEDMTKKITTPGIFSDVTKIVKVVGGIFTVLALSAAICCRTDSSTNLSTEDLLVQRLLQAKTKEEVPVIFGATNENELITTEHNKKFLHLPGLSEPAIKKVLPHIQTLFGAGVVIAANSYSYSA